MGSGGAPRGHTAPRCRTKVESGLGAADGRAAHQGWRPRSSEDRRRVTLPLWVWQRTKQLAADGSQRAAAAVAAWRFPAVRLTARALRPPRWAGLALSLAAAGAGSGDALTAFRAAAQRFLCASAMRARPSAEIVRFGAALAGAAPAPAAVPAALAWRRPAQYFVIRALTARFSAALIGFRRGLPLLAAALAWARPAAGPALGRSGNIRRISSASACSCSSRALAPIMASAFMSISIPHGNSQLHKTRKDKLQLCGFFRLRVCSAVRCLKSRVQPPRGWHTDASNRLCTLRTTGRRGPPLLTDTFDRSLQVRCAREPVVTG